MNKIKFVLKAFWDAPGIIHRAGLKKFYLIPGFLGILVFVIITYILVKTSFFSLGSWLDGMVDGDVSSWIRGIVLALKAIMWTLVIFLYFYTYKTVFLMLISPILSYVSERTDGYLTHKDFPFSFKDNVRFLGRGALIGIICFVKQTFATVVILLMGVIFPFLSFVVPILVFLVQGYFSGYSFMDYTLERYKYTTRESMRFMKKKRMYSLLSGSIFSALLLIPVIGIFVAPIITCVAVTQITLGVLDRKDEVGYVQSKV